MSDAKAWLIKLQKVDGRGYSSIHSIRGVLRPAFQMAENDDLIRKNPFQFELASVVVNDSVTREAITRKQQREYLKFVFTKLVSKILQLIEELGKRVNITKEDLAHLDISIVKQLYVDLYSGNIGDMFIENIRNNKKQYNCAIQIKLPSIIVSPESVYGFYLLNEEPNFITQEKTADTIILTDKNLDCEKKIVFIQSADPGYDFLFSKNIGGLITQFGGVNSHMAIRCAELGIPALIGVGESNYKEWSKYSRMTIDCLNKQIMKIT